MEAMHVNNAVQLRRHIMDIRYPAHPNDFKSYDTAAIRKDYVVEKLFVPGEMILVYSHVDRIIFGGICPTSAPLELKGGKELGSEYFLERREVGIINIGAPGVVSV